MADNYLENKMEDYRRDCLNGQSRRRVSSSGNAPSLPVVSQRIAVVVENEALAGALLETFSRVGGLKVAFVGTDYRGGNLLAQKCGALFVKVPAVAPDAVEVLLNQVSMRWDGVDVIVTDNPDCVKEGIERKILVTIAHSQNHCSEAVGNSATSGTSLADVTNIIVPVNGCEVSAISSVVAMLLTSPTNLISAITLSPGNAVKNI